MQSCTSFAIRYLYCISSRCYVFVQEAIKDFEFEFMLIRYGSITMAVHLCHKRDIYAAAKIFLPRHN